MKLIRFGETGRERPGVQLDDGTRLDLSYHISDYTPEFFAANGPQRVQEIVAARENCPTVDASVRLGAPLARPHKFIAIGLNYKKHAQESNMPIPKEPVVFTKQTNCISGPHDEIPLLPGSTRLDYEVELALVMKNTVKHLSSEASALEHVAGYLVCNDVSEREVQLTGPQWTIGKSHDGYGPLGPYLVTPDEVGNPHELEVRLSVNGKQRQLGNTNDFIFNLNKIIVYLSQYMTLEPGDIITTGTPHGVAMGMDDPNAFLKDGDVVEVEIDKLGVQRSVVKAL